MPTETDLTGLGMAPSLAAELGNQPNVVTCTGTSSQAGAATIYTKNSELSAADSSHNGAILPAAAKVGSPFFLFTSSSTSAIVYPPVNHYLNGGTSNSLTVAQNKGAICFKYKQTAAGVGYWFSILTS